MSIQFWKYFLGICILLICIVSESFGQIQKIDQIQYELTRDKSIMISWRANFPAPGSDLTLTAMDTNGNPTKISVPAATIQRTPIISTGASIPNAVVFTASSKYGIGMPINEYTKSLTVMPAVPLVDAAGKPIIDGEKPVYITSEQLINMQPIKDYFTNVDLIDKLQSDLAKALPPVVPKIIISGVSSISDRSIVLKAKANTFVKAQAFAFAQTSFANSFVTDNSFFKSEEIPLFDNTEKEFTINNLSTTTNYVIVVREISVPLDPMGKPTRTAAFDHVEQDPTGKPLKTSKEIPKPSAAVLNVQNKKNTSVLLNVISQNANQLLVTIEEANAIGVFKPLPSATDIKVNAMGDGSPYDVIVNANLTAGKSYHAVIKAVAADAHVETFVAPASVPFQGLANNLFDNIDVEINSQGVNFKPLGTAEDMTLSVTASVNGPSGPLKITKDNKSAAKSPVCTLDISQITTQAKPSGQPTTSTNASATTNIVTFVVTATAADKSDRTQTATFSISLASDSTAPKSSNDKNALKTFGQSLIGNIGNKRVETRNAQGSPLGTILGIVLSALF